MQPSTTAAAVPRPFAASRGTGITLQLHFSPGVTDAEIPRHDDGPKARNRPRSLHQSSEEQEHVPSVAEDASVGEREGGPLLENVDNVIVDVDAGLQRQQEIASRIPADGDADSGAGAEAALIRRGDFTSLRGQCNDGDSFTVTSLALPIADGCYSAVVGTNFGEGFLYSTDEQDDERLIYPKLITRDGESKVSASSLVVSTFAL